MSVITFTPIYMERVWGGRELAGRLNRELPGDGPIGESWEIVDREDAQSVVSEGPLRGESLHDLWTNRRDEIFGVRHARHRGRFPVLCKLLDARDRLSVQVHPPARVAPQLGGEPKTEMWYFLSCDPGSLVYAGLKSGTTNAMFRDLLHAGRVEDCLHILPTREGDSIFIPSGRLHAIGGGNVIVEIQQNSDTTYRVFDWNRTGLDGKPRALHIEETLLSADFTDYEPGLEHKETGDLAKCDHFRVERTILTEPRSLAAPGDFSIVTVVKGRAVCDGRTFGPGDFFLLPATGAEPVSADGASCAVLVTTLP